MPEKAQEISTAQLGQVLLNALTQSQKRGLGDKIHFGFKDPQCDVSTEPYRGWTMFVSVSVEAEPISLELKNDQGIIKIYKGSADTIARIIDLDQETPTCIEIIKAIEADVLKRNQVFEAWMATQTATTTQAVTKMTR